MDRDDDISHEVKHLPHQRAASLPFRHYSGYQSLETGEDMFYWYAESSSSPKTDPIVLWLNGGPGCSSLGGFFTENGPFVVDGNLTVNLNPFRWNRNANLVWLESPAGVGFSRAPDNVTEYYNDEITTRRSYAFLKKFINRYPSLQGRDFYVTGESYAGIYIPALIEKLVASPIEGLALKGLAIGNPYTDQTIDGNAYMDYCYTHAMISYENYQDMKKYCHNGLGKCMYSSTNCTESCSRAIQEGILESDTDQLNPYYIYGNKCLLQNGQAGSLRYTTKPAPLSPAIRNQPGGIGPCTDKFTETYLNLKSVQEAIHMTHHDDPAFHWTDCNDHIASTYERSDSALPHYRTFLSQKPALKVLIYSGDADSVVNFIGTERWIAGPEGLQLPVVKKWHAWFGSDHQLAGYEQHYPGIVFKTIKGAGHMVPAIRPLHAFNMFQCFLNESHCNSDVATQELLALTRLEEEGEDSSRLPTMSSHSNNNDNPPRAWVSGKVMTTGVVVSLLVAMSVALIQRRRTSRHNYQQV